MGRHPFPSCSIHAPHSSCILVSPRVFGVHLKPAGQAFGGGVDGLLSPEVTSFWCMIPIECQVKVSLGRAKPFHPFMLKHDVPSIVPIHVLAVKGERERHCF